MVYNITFFCIDNNSNKAFQNRILVKGSPVPLQEVLQLHCLDNGNLVSRLLHYNHLALTTSLRQNFSESNTFQNRVLAKGSAAPLQEVYSYIVLTMGIWLVV